MCNGCTLRSSTAPRPVREEDTCLLHCYHLSFLVLSLAFPCVITCLSLCYHLLSLPEKRRAVSPQQAIGSSRSWSCKSTRTGSLRRSSARQTRRRRAVSGLTGEKSLAIRNESRNCWPLVVVHCRLMAASRVRLKRRHVGGLDRVDRLFSAATNRRSTNRSIAGGLAGSHGCGRCSSSWPRWPTQTRRRRSEDPRISSRSLLSSSDLLSISDGISTSVVSNLAD